MTSPKQNSNFHTPDKPPRPDSKHFVLSSTFDKHTIHITSTLTSPSPSKTNYGPILTSLQLKNQKLTDYSNKIEQLKQYVYSNNTIEKRVIRQIFKWEDITPQDNLQLKYLKQLSTKVKGLIKQNYELKHNTEYQQLIKLKAQNKKLSKIVSDINKTQQVNELLEEQNSRLRDQIRNKQQSNFNYNQIIPQKTPWFGFSQSPKLENNHNNTTPSALNIGSLVQRQAQSSESLENAKKFIMNYIKASIQSNEQKLTAQQKYINTLQTRIAALQQINKKLDHFSFERAVQLQDSVRKSKNFSVGAVHNKGEDHEPHQQPLDQQSKGSIVNQRESISRKLFADRPYTSSLIKQSKQPLNSFPNYVRQNELHQKYETEVQSHIQTISDKQAAELQVQKLQAEKKELYVKVAQLTTELRLSQSKIYQLQTVLATFNNNSGPPQMQSLSPKSAVGITVQLSKIRQDLQSCELAYSKSVQNQVSRLISERNTLKRDLQQLRNNTVAQSKYSAYQKQIFYLKQKNLQLQQMCQFYQQQVQEYDLQLKELAEEKERRLAKDISQQIRLIDSETKVQSLDLEALQWNRKAHNCLINSANRLLHLQSRLKTKMQLSI